MVKKTLKQSDPQKEKRQLQYDQVKEAIASLDNDIQAYRKSRKRQLTPLESEALGLYEEMDKLSKKAPAESVTDLALRHINDLIKETKALVKDDPYIQRIDEFISAGDNPENRDVVVILRTVRQALQRFDTNMSQNENQVHDKLSEARFVCEALKLYLGGNTEVKPLDMMYGQTFEEWFKRGYNGKYFDFAKLDEIDIPTYFSVDEQL